MKWKKRHSATDAAVDGSNDSCVGGKQRNNRRTGGRVIRNPAFDRHPKGTNRMNQLVTHLHELNRADNQQLPLHKELFAVGDLIERLVESFSGPARQKNINFIVNAGKGT